MLKYKFARRSLVRQMETDCIKWGGYGVTLSGVGCEQGLKLVLTAILFGWHLPVPIRYDCTLDMYVYEHYNRSSPKVIRTSELPYVRVPLSIILPYRFSLYFLCILLAHTALALRGALHGPIIELRVSGPGGWLGRTANKQLSHRGGRSLSLAPI
ncbi:conserved hypothetical protein [Trichinella spiralis]|uniref:hypothetical protein n=1 Tax=Trichinella spiralis TaxID=6334 RepID=UPI0001EFB52F|nr:conserved hypothetical protein [Trichinella spiralis]